MSVSRLCKFQAFILGHQSSFEISEVNFYSITLFYTFMEAMMITLFFKVVLLNFNMYWQRYV